MMAWIVALVVWIAAGARIGRVLARKPTPLRNAMAIAVVGAAVASTIVIPDVWALVEKLSPGSGLPRTLTFVAWLFFAAGSAIGAISVWPMVPRRWMRPIAVAVLATAVVLGIAAWLDLMIPVFVFMTAALALVIGTGLRHVEWTPLGRGIALIVVGTSILFVTVTVTVTVAVALIGELSGEPDGHLHMAGVHRAAAMLVSVGAVWVLAEMAVRARRDLRRTRDIHRTLVERFPEVISGVGGTGSSVLRASDRVAQILDAMYVQSGAGMFETHSRPPVSAREHARIVAQWVRDPVGGDVLDTRWIAAPAGMSPRRWVLAIADEYNRGTEESDDPAAEDPAVESSNVDLPTVDLPNGDLPTVELEVTDTSTSGTSPEEPRVGPR
ncbi:MAG: hypothetical protein GX610_13530 [Rhodococcus sp.]|nr:hypothetical protein [Rhodococcus sp. (in: high G+C Gram-positive bacteria)]